MRIATGLCLVLTVLVSLWPFDFQTRCSDCPNGVVIDPAVQGLHFRRIGMVVDEAAGGVLHARLSQASEITVAVHITSGTLFQGGPARIISLSDGPSLRNVTLGQHRDAIVLRVRTPLTGANGSDPQTSAAGVVSTERARLYVATYDGAAFRIYADGVLEAERTLAAGGFDGWAPDFALHYGNEASGDRPWRGQLHDAAIYDRAMAPERIADLRAEDLKTATADRVLHLASRCPPQEALTLIGGRLAGACLAPSRFENQHQWDVLRTGLRAPSDAVQNALTWVPLGVLMVLSANAWLVRWRVPAALVLACLILGVEAGQSGLFSRTSALMDALFAMLGCLGGAMLGRRILPGWKALWLRS